MSGRLASVVLTACLTLVLGLSPCAALMMGSASGHDCCDKSQQHSHEQKSNCELLCALADGPFTSIDRQTLEKQTETAVAVPQTVGLVSAPVSTVRTDITFRPPDHALPLYVLHAAFLV